MEYAMSRNLFALIVFLVSTSGVYALGVDGVEIPIPRPVETNELCAEDAKVRAEVSGSVFAGYELLTCFINKNDWERNRQQYVYMVLMDKRAAGHVFTSAEFESIKRNFDTGMVQFAKAVRDIKTHPENPEQLKKVEHINDLIVDHFERFYSSIDSQLLIERQKMDMQINGKRVLTNSIVATGLVCARGKIFGIKMSKFLGGRADFDESDYLDVKGKLKNWAVSILELSKT
jgi:hypothetical protein